MHKTAAKQRKKSPSRGGYRKNSGRKAVGQIRTIRASDEQWQRWSRAAKKANQSTAAWIRDAADSVAGGRVAELESLVDQMGWEQD